ncbi:MAG: hypothetical protein M1833_003865 [Piccolia ochrophora]|nr:MAG: hypothetical protein M1833_003865 [Piccolia ochrophora]
MKTPFKGYLIALAGEFGGSRTYANIERWIVNGGGRYSSTVTKDVTHVICTYEDFKAKSKRVKQALSFPTIQLLSFEWLEDTLNSKRVRKGKKYTIQNVAKAYQRDKKNTSRALKSEQEVLNAATCRFQNGCEAAQAELASGNYHIYRDTTLFEYDIVLARADLEKNRNERYQLRLYETHAVPRMYAVTAKYTRPFFSSTVTLAPPNSFFKDAFIAFRRFFKGKTHIEWEERQDGKKWAEDAFWYTLPAAGKPRGEMPPGWMKLEPEKGSQGGDSVIGDGEDSGGQGASSRVSKDEVGSDSSTEAEEDGGMETYE